MARTKQTGERRLQIIEAARKLFGQYSYEKTTMDDIAREVGIGKGSIYLEFDSKEAILTASIEQFIEAELAQMQAQVDAASLKATGLEDNRMALAEMLLAHILSVYDRVSAQQHSPEGLVLTSLRIQPLKERFIHRKNLLIATMLSKIALQENGATVGKTDTSVFLEQAALITKALSYCMPPYIHVYPLSREGLSQDATALIALLLKEEY